MQPPPLLVKEGFLTKNHAGYPYSLNHNKRWFTSTGFQVVYYSAESNPDKQPEQFPGPHELKRAVV